jgi:predicted small metal-binding protein
MDKLISCWNVTGKCYFVVRTENEEEAIRQLADHAASAHQMTLTEEMKRKAREEARRKAA